MVASGGFPAYHRACMSHGTWGKKQKKEKGKEEKAPHTEELMLEY